MILHWSSFEKVIRDTAACIPHINRIRYQNNESYSSGGVCRLLYTKNRTELRLWTYSQAQTKKRSFSIVATLCTTTIPLIFFHTPCLHSYVTHMYFYQVRTDRCLICPCPLHLNTFMCQGDELFWFQWPHDHSSRVTFRINTTILTPLLYSIQHVHIMMGIDHFIL